MKIGKKDIIKILSEVEQLFPVNSWQSNEIDLWPLIRHEINDWFVNSMTVGSGSKSIISVALEEIKGTMKLSALKFRDRKKNDSIRPADVLMITHPTRRVSFQGSFFDRISDPFARQMIDNKVNFLTLEWSYNHSYKIPRAMPSSFIQMGIDISLFKAMLFKSKYKLDVTVLEKFNEFIEFLETKQIDVERFIKKVKYDFNTILYLADYLEKVLKKVSPRFCFHFPYYSLMGFATTIACRRSGVKSVDIQHGFIGEFHIGYNGYETISDDGLNLLPDYIWCWDYETKKKVDCWSAGKAVLGGNLWMELWKNKSIQQQSLSLLEPLQELARKRKIIILTLTDEYLFPDFLREVINQSEDKYFWMIRFHHNMKKEDQERIVSFFPNHKYVDFEFANKLTLLDLIVCADLHVTLLSSSLVEAKELGVPTVVTSQIGIELFQKEIAEGWAKPALSAEDLLEALNDQLSFTKPDVEKEEFVALNDFLQNE